LLRNERKDLAIWEQADIKYSGRRHDDEGDEDDRDAHIVDDGAPDDQLEEESEEQSP
jgi:hypothetical protein